MSKLIPFLLGLLLLFTIPNADAAVDGRLKSLIVQNLSPAFKPNIKKYTIPKTSECSIPVTASLYDPSLRLYVANTPASSGQTVNAWICDGNNKIEIIVYQNWTELSHYTITPKVPPSVDLTVNTAGSGKGSVTSSPTGIQCGTDCAETYLKGTEVSLTATAGDGSVFGGWSGACTGNAACELPLQANTAVTATFTRVNTFPLKVTRLGKGGGVVSSDIAGIDCGTSCTKKYPENTNVRLTAVPDNNSRFTGWSGACQGKTTCSVSMTAARNVAATFTPIPLPPLVPVDKATAVRFLEHASFGPSPASITAVQQAGLARWQAEQWRLAESPITDDLSTGQVAEQLFLNMANGSDQLRQRMMFALGQTIVVSSRKNVNGEELIPWVRLLSSHAFGNFRTLLHDVTLSPTMGKYLDLANSIKTTVDTVPNENYPRELLQLFSIGLWQLEQDGSLKKDASGNPIPTYTQADIVAFSRALTGWTYPTRPGEVPRSRNWEYFVGNMEPRQENHDTGSKTLLNGKVLPAGQTVEQDLAAVLDNIFNHPNVPPFMATRLIRSLVSSNPSPEYIRRVADVFVNNGQGVRGDLRAVLNAVLTDVEAFIEPSAHSGHLKDPVLHFLGLSRALQANISDPGMFLYSFRNLGQEVLSPPTVFSFYSPLSKLPEQPALYAPEFQIYPPGLAIQRANFTYQILNGELGDSFRVDLQPYLKLANQPQALVEKVNQDLLFGRMSAELRAVLVKATKDTPQARDRALGALYLTTLSNEYLIQH